MRSKYYLEVFQEAELLVQENVLVPEHKDLKNEETKTLLERSAVEETLLVLNNAKIFEYYSCWPQVRCIYAHTNNVLLAYLLHLSNCFMGEHIIFARKVSTA
ncbi:uncharacterized protein LOC133714797 [Rosa rugosa]|uniref:uncharacterized protein LOC133714797 n=1 Tax=Rosa rugosa TaxID=74645 RepID=UPI002B4132F9|nr:uncharacterized protein LOC133714797 [Rosa rugosa]